MSITRFDQLDLSKYYTYQDYLTWTFPERVELFLGKIFKMSPAPNRYHQDVSRNLFNPIVNFLKGQKCLVYAAPFDVRLPVSKKEGESDTVVQPDIVVVCDPSKLDEQGCNGAPDLVIEILSPGNSRKEMKEKFELYEASLVSEYWMVDPIHQDVVIYTLNADNKYIGSKPFVSGEQVVSHVIQGLQMEVTTIFKT